MSDANGITNVTCLFGTEGFTDELWEALKRVASVKVREDGDRRQVDWGHEIDHGHG